MTLVPAILGVLSQSIALATAHLVSLDLRDAVEAIGTLLERFVLQPFVAAFLLPAGALVFAVIVVVLLSIWAVWSVAGILMNFAFHHFAALVLTGHAAAAVHAATPI